MRVCCICGERIQRISSRKDGYCKVCLNEVHTVETTKTEVSYLEGQIRFFEVLDLLTQIDLILDSKGTGDDKLLMIKKCVEKKIRRQCKDE